MIANLTPFVLGFCQSVITFLFLFSSIKKIFDVSAFLDAVNKFKVLPSVIYRPMGWLFLFSELTIPIFLVLGGFWSFVGFSFAFLLLFIFSIALGLALLRKIQFDCNCFGYVSKEKSISVFYIIRNIGFMTCAIIGVFAQNGINSFSPRLDIGEWVLIFLLSIVFITLLLNLEEFYLILISYKELSKKE